MSEIQRPDSPVIEGSRPVTGAPMSPRAYNLAIAALLFASFLVMGLSARWVSSPSFYLTFAATADLLVIGSFIATIVGLFVMSAGKRRQSVPLSVVGFALFTLTFGFTLGAATATYDSVTVSTALLATAGVVALFGALGMAFPDFFAKVYRVCIVGLIGVLVAELVLMLMGVSQGVLDWVTLALFCGFVGYDLYRAANDVPTLPNALWHAADIFIDVANILLSLLNIMDRD